jgi:hypothetical protein
MLLGKDFAEYVERLRLEKLRRKTCRKLKSNTHHHPSSPQCANSEHELVSALKVTLLALNNDRDHVFDGCSAFIVHPEEEKK